MSQNLNSSVIMIIECLKVLQIVPYPFDPQSETLDDTKFF